MTKAAPCWLAFLRCRMKPDDIAQRAPWITDVELEQLQSDANDLSNEQLGKLIHLTWDERIACRVWFLPACDVTPEEASRLQAERDRANARKRQAERRESMKTMRHTSKRDDAVLRMLRNLPRLPMSGGLEPMAGWTPVSTLVKEAKRCDAFRRPDGRPISNLREPVHRVLQTLKEHGQIEIEQRPGVRGMVMYVRLAAQELAPNVAYLRTKVTDLVSAA